MCAFNAIIDLSEEKLDLNATEEPCSETNVLKGKSLVHMSAVVCCSQSSVIKKELSVPNIYFFIPFSH